MKRNLLLSVCLLASLMAFSQAKKPTLMVVPSDVWCNQNGYVQIIDNQGTQQVIPDYQQALQNDMDLKLAIAKINDLMMERSFPCKDLESQIKIINQQNAEANLLTSKNGNELAETPIDRLLRTAKADIILELTWDVTEQGPKRTLKFILEGKDAYTGKSIGGANGTSQPSFTADVAVLLEEAVVAHIDNFNNRLQQYFDDLFTNGREVALDIRVFQDNEAGIDLETEFDGLELSEIIDEWLAQNTVEGRFSKLGSSEYYISYEQVRIPLYNTRGTAIDTEAFARQLRNVLRKEPYNIPVKLLNRGLGKAVLVLGEK
ncbi:MAG: hypothetical protein IJS05_06170 [Paludibacteraceae bacterium]|nr:hypothetical protein [Paludibacteraceae bacterium]